MIIKETAFLFGGGGGGGVDSHISPALIRQAVTSQTSHHQLNGDFIIAGSDREPTELESEFDWSFPAKLELKTDNFWISYNSDAASYITQEICIWFMFCVLHYLRFYPYPSGLIHWPWRFHDVTMMLTGGILDIEGMALAT